MEIASTSGAAWLLTSDISERSSKDGNKAQDLSLLWLGNASMVSPSCNLHDGFLVYMYT